MNATIATAWQRRPSAAAVLLFTALLAQSPHAAAVFMRIAPHGADWEVWTSFVGAWVYAVALEGATAYFVWRSQKGWAFTFAIFSVAHNVAYYMPEAWTFTAWGAELVLRNVVGSVLISISLPIAIAAFSHVQAGHAPPAKDPQDAHQKAAILTKSDKASTDITRGEIKPRSATPEVTTKALDVEVPAAMEATPTVTESPEQPQPATPAAPAQPATPKSAPVLRKVGKPGKTNEFGMTDTALAELLGVARQRIEPMRKSGTLMARVARDLPQLAVPHTNGFNHDAQ